MVGSSAAPTAAGSPYQTTAYRCELRAARSIAVRGGFQAGLLAASFGLGVAASALVAGGLVPGPSPAPDAVTVEPEARAEAPEATAQADTPEPPAPEPEPAQAVTDTPPAL